MTKALDQTLKSVKAIKRRKLTQKNCRDNQRYKNQQQNQNQFENETNF